MARLFTDSIVARFMLLRLSPSRMALKRKLDSFLRNVHSQSAPPAAMAHARTVRLSAREEQLRALLLDVCRSIDAAGDVFSLASVFFQGPPPVDVLGVVIYATELLLWMGVLGAGGWYNLRPWVRSKGWLKGGHADQEGVSAEEEEEGERVDGGVTRRRRGEAEGGGVALHDLPSSTSVFRTASAEADVRQRHAASS